MSEQDNERHWWYYRKNDKVHGPYAAGLVSRYILLGRIDLTDEVSNDRINWRAAKTVREIIPDVLRGDMSDPFKRERLKAARRWADERYRGDRRYSEQEQVNRDRMAGDRRNEETPEMIEYREKRLRRLGIGVGGENTLLGWLLMFASMIAIAYAGYFAYTHQSPEEKIDCDSTPAPGVNWRNCIMEGRQLPGVKLAGAEMNNANLTGANLVLSDFTGANVSYTNFSLANLESAIFKDSKLLGASFRKANLRGADFSGADMSFVNFEGADITNIKLDKANLSKAIWIDGLPCLPNSVGGCLR